MAELIPSYSLTAFRKLKAEELKQLKCFEVTYDGEYVCTVIVPQTPYIRNQAENMGQLSNAVGGKTLEEITEVSIAPV